MFFCSQFANVACFRTQLIQKSLLNAKTLGNTLILLLQGYLTNDFCLENPEQRCFHQQQQISASNPFQAEIGFSAEGTEVGVLRGARSSIIPRKTFTFTAASLSGRTLPAPRGLHCTNVRDKGMGKHTWSSNTWHLACAVVGLLTTLFLKSSDL